MWALSAYALAVAALQAVHPSPGVCFLIVVCALLLSPQFFPKLETASQGVVAGSNELIGGFRPTAAGQARGSIQPIMLPSARRIATIWWR